MGRRGPSKTPQDILKLSGSWRGERGGEPKAEPATSKSLRCPSWLSPLGKRTWKKIVQQLGVMGILTFADEILVARYCDVYALWRNAHDHVMKHGVSYEAIRDGAASFHKYPETVVQAQLLPQLTAMEDRMGLSPGARANLAIDNKGLSNEPKSKDRFFKGG